MENITPKPILPEPGEEEVWKTHPVYTKYEVSTFGNVRRKDNQYLMTTNISGRGYLSVHLRAGIINKNGNGKHCRIHKLVAETFLGEAPGPEYECDHLDRNRRNNYYKNLRWATHAENMANASKERHKQVFMNRPAIVLLENGTDKLIREFTCLAQVVEELDLSPACVRDNIHGYKPSYKFGYFMTKPDYLKKNAEKI